MTHRRNLGIIMGVGVLLAGCPFDRPPVKEFRSYDGTGNNQFHDHWGNANQPLARLSAEAYEDGVHAPSGADRPSARHISNLCVAQSQSMPNSTGLTDLFWQWGQFLDHDIDLTPVFDPPVPFDIPVPTGDTFFDPMSTGTQTIPLDRSFTEMFDGVAQQINEITSYIDGSNVYGSDHTRAEALRTMDGTGRLKTSAGDLLPFNTDGIPNAPSTAPTFFVAGDVRSNEQAYLTAMHTLWVREHNYHAGRLRQKHPMWDGDTVYEMARMIVAAELQVITYEEFVPLLIGEDAMPRYRGYRRDVKVDITNEFATAAFRVGHTLLSSQLLRLDANLAEIPEGHLALADAFFNPMLISDVGIEPFIRGQRFQLAQEVDPFIVDDVRNFLFGPPGAGGFDLASLNIQRGRDHGLPDYNTVRVALGLGAVADFSEISSDSDIVNNLAAAYANVNQIDLWVGGLSEDHVPGAVVGETFREILRRQFIALRDGDRFWYENYLPAPYIWEVEDVTLADVIRRNTSIGDELGENVFLMP
jgi:peroxidase